MERRKRGIKCDKIRMMNVKNFRIPKRDPEKESKKEF